MFYIVIYMSELIKVMLFILLLNYFTNNVPLLYQYISLFHVVNAYLFSLELSTLNKSIIIFLAIIFISPV